MLVGVVSFKNTLVQQAFSVPDIVGDLCLFRFRGELSVFDLHRYDFLLKHAFIIGNKENTTQRDLYRAFDAAER